VREHFPVPQSRRGLLITAVVLVLVVAGAAAGAILALAPASARGRGLTRASFPGYGLSFRYPSDWQRKDWCWLGTAVFPLTLLTTAEPPPCKPGTEPVVVGTPFPPPQRLGRDGVAAWWTASDRPGLAGVRPNARVDGEPARITVLRETTRRTPHSFVNCVGTGATQQHLSAQIQSPSSVVGQVQLDAVICGPNFGAGEADVRQMLAGVRFAR
jgi:hypothetical protein